MEDYGVISRIDSLPLPQGPHVRDFDAAKKAAKEAARAQIKGVSTGEPPQPHAASASATPFAPARGSEKQLQALESNASSELQSLAADTMVSGEYVDSTESSKPKVRNVAPISRALLSHPNTTMERLHKASLGELKVLDTLSNEGRQVIRTRLMVIWEEMSVRFERGESINGIAGTGGKGMGKYLRSIGFDPAKRRSWKFEIRQEEGLRLARENPPPKRTLKKKEIVISTETEANLIAKAGVRMAQLLADNGVMPQERINKAEAVAKEVLNAIEGGRYERLEPPPSCEIAPMPLAATYKDWENHHIPAPEFKVKYFAQALESFTERYAYAFRGSAFKKILAVLKDNPEQVSSNAHDFAQLAVALRGAADNLNLLSDVITIGLTANTAPEAGLESVGPQNDSNLIGFPDSEPQSRPTEPPAAAHGKLEQAAAPEANLNRQLEFEGVNEQD
jgi:hypothetical protein